MSVPKEEIEVRITRLQERLQASRFDGAFLAQRVDIYYFSGSQDADYMFIPARGLASVFYSVEPSNNRCETGKCKSYLIDEPRDIGKILGNSNKAGAQLIGLELDCISFLEFQIYREFFGGDDFFDVSPLVLDLRAKKSGWELERMKEAASVSVRVFEAIKSLLRPGIREMELAAKAEAYAQICGESFIDIRVRDYKTEGYPWHVLSGYSGGMIGLLDSPASGSGTSAAFPCGAGYKTIQANEPVMVDFAYELNGYHVDETRMFSIGSMPDDAMRASEAAIEIHNSVLERAMPGTKTGDLFDYSVAKARELGYESTYLGPEEYQVSFVGHGIGAELIERPLIAKGRDDVLEPGMTFALEPKIVFKDRFMAGVESVVAVTEDGYELISHVPVEVFIC